MCTGMEALLYGAGASAAVGTVNAIQARKDAKAERARAESDRLKAETDAANRASGQTQMARRALAKNSLFTGGGTEGGKTTLGVG